MNKELLFSDGYLTFNLKTHNTVLYDELRKLIPYKSIDNFNEILSTFIFSAELEVDVKTFYKEFEKYNLIDHDDYTYKKIKVESHRRASDGGYGNQRNLTTEFPVKDFDKLSKIHSIIFNNFKFKQNQSWFGSHIYDNVLNIRPVIAKIFKSLLSDFYDIDVERYFEENFVLNISSFGKGSLITKHSDGQNPGRYAAILLYLNDDWNSNDGGQLVLKDNINIEPEFGNIVILDFTKNNVEHSVTEVVGDRNRWAFISFIEIL